MADDALYQAARKGDLPETRVRRPIAVIAGRDVRRRACDYRPVVVSLANLPDQARRVSCLPEPRSESVVCRRSCKMAPTFPDASAFMTGRALPIFLVAPFIEQPNRLQVPRGPRQGLNTTRARTWVGFKFAAGPGYQCIILPVDLAGRGTGGSLCALVPVPGQRNVGTWVRILGARFQIGLDSAGRGFPGLPGTASSLRTSAVAAVLPLDLGGS
jgi:hypothetical protein